MKVLLVDDDEALCTVFSTALKQEGFEVVTAYDGRSGFDRAKQEMPNLILLDQVLPDIAGNEILKQLKFDAQTKDIPVMMLSNFGQEDIVKQAINDGAQDYIFKYRVEVQDLVNKVKEALRPSSPTLES